MISLIKAIFQRVSEWGSLSFPMSMGVSTLVRTRGFCAGDFWARLLGTSALWGATFAASWVKTGVIPRIIRKDRDLLIRDPLCLSLLSLIKAILSLIDSYINSSSLIKATFQRVS